MQPTARERAEELHKQGNYEAAVPYWREHVAAEPDDAAALARLAACRVLSSGGCAKAHDEAARLARRAVQLRPGCARLRHTLGRIYEKAAPPRWAEAAECYERACEKDRGSVQFLMDLAKALRMLDRPARAAEAYARAAALAPSHPCAHFRLAMTLRRMGRGAAAAGHLKRHLEIAPSHAAAAFWLAALSGDAADCPAAAACPRDMVAGLFDEYAETFDHQLVNELGYQTPELLRDLLFATADADAAAGAAATPAPRAWHAAADLGCGTGLMGPLLRPRCGRLVGVDLSAGMVAKARARGCYDAAEVGELVEWLLGQRAEGGRQERQREEEDGQQGGQQAEQQDEQQQQQNNRQQQGQEQQAQQQQQQDQEQQQEQQQQQDQQQQQQGQQQQQQQQQEQEQRWGPFDLLVAADVLVYIGDLAPLLEAAAAAAPARGALFALSTERLGGGGGGDDSSSSGGGDAEAGAAGGGPRGYKLQPTGRYAHAAGYLRVAAERAGWAVAALRPAVIRYNAGQPIHGNLAVLRRV